MNSNWTIKKCVREQNRINIEQRKYILLVNEKLDSIIEMLQLLAKSQKCEMKAVETCQKANTEGQERIITAIKDSFTEMKSNMKEANGELKLASLEQFDELQELIKILLANELLDELE